MNAANWSLRAWAGLLILLFIALEMNGIRYGMYLSDASPGVPNEVTGQLYQIETGAHPVYVTAHERLVLQFWLGSGTLAAIAVLGLAVGNGIVLQRERRLAAARRRDQRRPRR